MITWIDQNWHLKFSSGDCGSAPTRLDGAGADGPGGAINGATFTSYAEQFLAPTLHRGDVVIMNNVSSHKVVDVRETTLTIGVLPATYSPDITRLSRLLPS